MLKIILKILFFLFISPNILFASSLHMLGEKGKLSDVTRIVEIKMYDNYYEPNKLNIKKGETVKFIVHNYGEFVHEFNIATKKMHIEHQSEMAKMVENQILLPDKIDKKKMKELAKTDHSMAHSHANSVLLEPNESAVLIWKFSTDKKLEGACNIPSHYQSGMIINIDTI